VADEKAVWPYLAPAEMFSWLDAVTDEAKSREGVCARESQRAKEAAAGGGEVVN
jgi:hypothetical protein